MGKEEKAEEEGGVSSEEEEALGKGVGRLVLN